MSLIEAAESGDYLKTLENLRDELARAIEDVAAKDKAPLTKQLLDVLAQIKAVKPVEVKDGPLDELAKRKADRAANAKGATITPRSGLRG